MAPPEFSEVELAMSLHVLWADWIAQPPEHRAKYIAVHEYRQQMDDFDEGERAMKQYLLEQQGALGKGRR